MHGAAGACAVVGGHLMHGAAAVAWRLSWSSTIYTSHTSLIHPFASPSEQHTEMAADKERELARVLAEKNASLESLVRATAAATKEAGRLVRR